MADDLTRLQEALAERYTVQWEVGHGGMATVYLAKDLKHHRPVAIKVLKPELAAALGPERFLREIALSARLRHPHILPLHDSGEAAGFLYYVMPYVEGESLRDRLNREKQLPLEDALQIAREVADALSYAHSHDVVHRDIKPENILLESGHAVVADFGIARAITAAGGEQLTGTGVAIGTPAYMSPEQAAGSKAVDGRSDLYSLGCVLYEMLAGQPPFTGPTAESIVRQHLTTESPSITGIRPGVPGWVAAALTRALAKTPADRFHPVALFAEALARRESAAVSAVASAPVAPSLRRVRRLVLFGGVGVVALGILLLMLRPGREGSRSTKPSYERTAIAVLPFLNLSAEGPYAYFAGGLHDELLTQLSKVAALTVISRTSVMGYTGKSTPLRQIATELGVGSVVEGSVQVVGERLRVNVQLIDAATDAHLWAERYDRTLDDAFAIQSEVAQQIVAAVGAALTSSQRQGLAAAPTANAEAYRLYLQGGVYRGREGRENWEIAQQFYERALALDPGFALAHAALSGVHAAIYIFGYDRSLSRAVRAREEAEAALRLAPDLPQAHVAMGWALFGVLGGLDDRRALEEFRVALKGLPNDAGVWAAIGYAQRNMGNWNEVLAAFERAKQLDPRAAGMFLYLGGHTYRLLHLYADAVRADEQALSLDPDLLVAAVFRGWTHVSWQGQLDTLRAILNRLPGDAAVGELGTRAAQYALLLLWERQADSLLRVLRVSSVGVFEGNDFFLPSPLYAGWAHQLRGDRPAARAAFDSARVLLDSVIRALPDDWRVHSARGQALAGLGRRDEALREARWLQQSPVYHDGYHGFKMAADRAGILAQTGDADAAVDEIEPLLAGASWLSVNALRLDPRWDPIREQPRFKALLGKYAGR